MNDLDEVRGDESVTDEAGATPRASLVIARATLPALLFIAVMYAVGLIGARLGSSPTVGKAVVRTVVIGIVIVMQKRGSLPDLPLRFDASDLVRAFALGALMQVAFAFIASLIMPDASSGAASFDADTVVSFVVSVVLTPICEELIFRGIAFRELRRCAPFPVAAAISSMMFALVHPSVISASAAFIAGIVLSYMYEKSASFAVTVTVHASFNAVSYFLVCVPDLPFPVRLAVGIAASAASVGIMLIPHKNVK